MTLQVQFLTMGMMFGSGLALGVLFDTYRVLTGQLKVPRWLIPPLDLLYWTFATLFVFRALFLSNQGQVRVFVFIGLMAGMLFHFLLLSRPTIRIVLFVIRLIKRLIRLIIRMVDLLIITPILALYKFLLVLLGFLGAVAIFLYKIVLQLVYPLWRLVRFLGLAVWRRISWPRWMTRTVRKTGELWRKWFRRTKP